MTWRALVLGALFLVGCSSITDEQPTASPLDQFYADYGSQAEAIAAMRTEVQDNIAGCMATHGFVYIPIATSQLLPQDTDRNELTEREWAQEYGYGIVSSAEGFADGRPDPNVKHMSAMTNAERVRYLEQLEGTTQAEGCQAISLGQATNATDLITTFDALARAQSDAMSEVMARPELVAPLADWASCMRSKGYEVNEPGDPERFIEAAAREVTAPVTAWLATLDQITYVETIEGGISNVAGYPSDELAAVREIEIETAIADLDCYDQHVAEILDPLRLEAEQSTFDSVADDG